MSKVRGWDCPQTAEGAAALLPPAPQLGQTPSLVRSGCASPVTPQGLVHLCLGSPLALALWVPPPEGVGASAD